MRPTPKQQGRQSACAQKALQAEIERVCRMSIEERIKTALSMRSRFAWLQPDSKTHRP
jgi:hypothetical protein